MNEALSNIGIFVLFPVVAVIAGGVLGAFRPPGPRLRSAVQHLAAGVVFAAVATELLPEMMETDQPLPLAIGFLGGVALMLIVRQLTQPATEGASSRAGKSTGLIITVGIDIAIDGLLVGIGFAAGTETGVLITIALTLEVLFLGLATASELAQEGAQRGRVIGVTTGLAVVLAVAAVTGTLLLSGLSGAPFVAVLAFGAAALLYLVTEELLVEAHEVPETPLLAAMFFVGFLALLVMAMFA